MEAAVLRSGIGARRYCTALLAQKKKRARKPRDGWRRSPDFPKGSNCYNCGSYGERTEEPLDYGDGLCHLNPKLIVKHREDCCGQHTKRRGT